MNKSTIVTRALTQTAEWAELRKQYTACHRWHYDQFQEYAIKDGWTVSELLHYWDTLPVAMSMQAQEGKRNRTKD